MTDPETTPLKEEFIFTVSTGRGHAILCTATWEAPARWDAEGVKEKARPRACIVVSAGRNGQGSTRKFEQIWDWIVGIVLAGSCL